MSALAAAGLAFLELDAASVGPFLLSRPFVVGPLLGAFLGRPWLGAGLGLAIEAVTLAELPLGGALGISAPVAAGTAVWFACGPWELPAEAAFFAGLGSGWLRSGIERILRAHGVARVRRVEEALAAGQPPELGAKILHALALQFAATFLLVFILLQMSDPLGAMWRHTPAFLRVFAHGIFLILPWFFAGRMAASLWRKA